MIAILQPFVPHYREDFFNGLKHEADIDIFIYEKNENTGKNNFLQSDLQTRQITSKEIKGVLIYNPFALLKRKYTLLVLMLNFAHVSTWLLLFTKFIHRKKIILWGHGISVKRYLEEERKPPVLLKWMIRMSDGIWFYTDKELDLWSRVFPDLSAVSLNNTISEVDQLITRTPADKQAMRKKYGIGQEVILIFSARFNTPDRRTDILQEVIRRLDNKKFGFIVIGDGKLKPDLSAFSNVYDFGGLYDRQVKNELFDASDIYFQPAWLGLSIVEAMAYGKPVASLKRTDNIKQCVEYAYVLDGFNGIICDDVESLISRLEGMPDNEIERMGQNGKRFADNNLSMKNMVAKGLDLIRKTGGKRR